MDGSFFGIRRGELMGYTFPKGLKIVTEQGENARFAADFLKDEIFFRSGAVIPVENAAQADREAEAGEGEILLQTDSELEEETFTLTRKGDESRSRQWIKEVSCTEYPGFSGKCT